MASASAAFNFMYMGPGTSVQLFLYGYPENWFVAYSIIPRLASNVPPGAVQVNASMSFDGAGSSPGGLGRWVTVTNRSVGPQPYISVELDHLVEVIQ